MAPARRQNCARSRSRSYNPPVPAPPLPSNQDLMPPSSRYLHNLRVIQRHDPSITSLFDQFPHVCVYHHKGDEWRKKGCEGAMFLFEREQEPKYGFYILNRNNTGDYIQRMTPEDDVEFASAYLIYRAFGKVTSDTIGLWTMVTQDREAMSQVMMRLHSYIKRDIPYPDEFRRRPATWATTPAPAHSQSLPVPSPVPAVQVSPASTSISALSALLAKLGDPTTSPQTPSSPRLAVSSVSPPATGIPLLDSIFASASEAASPAGTTPQQSAPDGAVSQTLFTNDVLTSRSSSTATSCGPTPTQHVSELPASSSLRVQAKPFINGHAPTAARRSVFPHPGVPNGREMAPSAAKSEFASQYTKGDQPNANGIGDPGGRRHSDQHLAVPEQPREHDEEEEAAGSVSLDMSEEGANPRPSSRRNRARKARKRERERDKRRLQKRGTTQDMDVGGEGAKGAGGRGADEVEWPLVDDRSLSMDEEAEEGNSVGLGDGLLNALAAASESELPNGQATDQTNGGASKKKNKERGKDRWKRRQREEAAASAQVSDISIDADLGTHPAVVRNALLDAYGSRRRVGDRVLDENAFASEVIELIHNDSTFVRELHQQYLKGVQV